MKEKKGSFLNSMGSAFKKTMDWSTEQAERRRQHKLDKEKRLKEIEIQGVLKFRQKQAEEQAREEALHAARLKKAQTPYTSPPQTMPTSSTSPMIQAIPTAAKTAASVTGAQTQHSTPVLAVPKENAETPSAVPTPVSAPQHNTTTGAQTQHSTPVLAVSIENKQTSSAVPTPVSAPQHNTTMRAQTQHATTISSNQKDNVQTPSGDSMPATASKQNRNTTDATTLVATGVKVKAKTHNTVPGTPKHKGNGQSQNGTPIDRSNASKGTQSKNLQTNSNPVVTPFAKCKGENKKSCIFLEGFILLQFISKMGLASACKMKMQMFFTLFFRFLHLLCAEVIKQLCSVDGRMDIHRHTLRYKHGYDK